MNHPIVEQFLIPIGIRFFFVFGIVGIAVGVGLIFNRTAMRKLSDIMGQWVSMRRSTRWLAIPRATGPVAQRFQRPIGTAFIVVAAYSTYALVSHPFDVGGIVAALHIDAPDSFAAWIIECARWCLIVGSILAIVIGIMLIQFPQALRALEARANHWYSFRSFSESGDTMHMGLDRWIGRHPRAMGTTIAAASTVVAMDYGLRLFGHG